MKFDICVFFSKIWRKILQKATISFVASVCLSVCLSVYPSAWSNSAPTGPIFMKFYICVFFRKSGEKIQFSLKTDENNGYFTWRSTYICDSTSLDCEPGSSLGIATELRAGRSGIESRWGRDFPPFQTGPWAHPASCKMVTGSFPGLKCGRGVLLTTHPLLVPRSWKIKTIPLPTIWATPGL